MKGSLCIGAGAALIGDMDQAALHGVLNCIRCPGLVLIEVRQPAPTPAHVAQ